MVPIRFVFVLCLLMCVLPGLFMTIKDEGGINMDTLIACTFGDGPDLDAHDPKVNSNIVNKNIKEILKAKTDKSKTTTISNQNVVIKQSDPSEWPDNPIFQSKNQCRNPGLIGLFGVTVEKPAFGCMPTINQSASMEISDIKKEIVEDYEEITQNIVSDIKVKVSGGKKPEDQTEKEKETADFIDTKTSELEEDVQDIILKLREKYSAKNQNAIIENYKMPFPCDCDMKAPEITQETRLDMFANDLYESVREKIQEKAIEGGMDIELEGLPTEPPLSKDLLCFFQILACTASMLGILYLVYSIVTNKDMIEEDKQRFDASSKMKASKLDSKLAMQKEKFEEGKGLRDEKMKQKINKAKMDEGKGRLTKAKEKVTGEVTVGPAEKARRDAADEKAKADAKAADKKATADAAAAKEAAAAAEQREDKQHERALELERIKSGSS